MADPHNSTGDGERTRRRNAWILLGTHAVAFVLLLVGFIARLNYVTDEGVEIDPMLIIIIAVATVLVILVASILLTFRRRNAIRTAVAADGSTAVAFVYWSHLNNPPFLAAPPRGTPTRGFDVAVTADKEGLRVRGMVRRHLMDFGLIPWEAVTAIEGSRKTVGVGVESNGGVLTIRTNRPVAPYTSVLEFFPIKETALAAAATLEERRG